MIIPDELSDLFFSRLEGLNDHFIALCQVRILLFKKTSFFFFDLGIDFIGLK